MAVGAVDLLIHRASPPARRLLWVVTLAFEPVPEELIETIWPEPPARLLLAELTEAGLLTEEEGSVLYAFHELVRERTAAWMAAYPKEKGERTEEQVWVAYGERYAAAFESLLRAEGEGSRALEAGRRGISYLVRARDFDRLNSFANNVVTSTNDPRLLRRVIAEFEAVIKQVPSGKARWSLRTALADALARVGRPDTALPYFEQAAAEAEKAGHWSHVGVICQHWAISLVMIGRLDDAKSTYLQSAGAFARAGSPRTLVLPSEFEALRVDVKKGEAERALPEIEGLLQEVRAWQKRHSAGQLVPEAPDPISLERVLVGGLSVAYEANVALERWEACLSVLTEIEETKRALGEGEHELARIRFNRSGPLLGLGRLDEAQNVLEYCLDVDRRADDLPGEATDLSELAALWDRRRDREQAAGLERQALAVRNRFPDLEGRSISHGNLANYLDRLGAAEKAAQHRLARIAYNLAIGHGQLLGIALRDLAMFIRRAAASGGRYELPRLAELLARPEFESLQRTLAERNVALDALQAEIDQHVEEVRRAVGEAGSA